MKPPVAKAIAAGILQRLAGFRGYPSKGEARFVEVLQECSVSVDHARAIVDAFTGEFPTIQEIRDTASNLRPQFEPVRDQLREWRELYGEPAPLKPDFEAGSDRRIDQCWRAIRAGLPAEVLPKINKLSWRELARLARQAGFADIAEAWEKSLV